MGFGQSSGDYRIQRFNTENGLPSNGIKGLQWDEETGFLWIATEAGIVRYNGMEFKIYGKEDEPQVGNERILFMVKNNAGRIYTADNRGNLFYVEKNKLRFLENRKIDVKPGNNFISLSVSDKLYNSRIDYQEKVFAPQFNQTFSTNDTAAFVLYLGRLYYYTQTVLAPVHAFKNEMEFDYGFQCGDNIFLVDALKNIFHFDPVTRRIDKIQFAENTGLSARDVQQGYLIWESGMSNPVILFGQKAWSLSYIDGKLAVSPICDNIPDDVMIRYAQYDEKRKILFIGTDSKGIIIIEPKRVHSVKAPNLPPTQRRSYYSQVELDDGSILTSEGHIIGNTSSTVKAIPISGKFSFNIMMTSDSVLWFAQTDSVNNPGTSMLYNYNFKTGKKTAFPRITEDYQMVMATAGNNMYISRNDGIYKLSGDSLERLHMYDHARKTGMDYDMREIAPGILLVAGCNAVLRFDIERRTVDTILKTGNYCYRTIWQYKDYVFIGSYGGGLYIYKNGVVKPLPLDKHKYLLFAHCFMKDDSDFCWISTNRGLFKASLPELIDVFDKNTTEVYYHYYGKNDGMEMTELNGGCTPCALRKRDKTMSFPTMDGLLWVDPTKASTALPQGEIYIDNISADNVMFNPDSFHLKNLSSKTGEIIIKLGIAAWGNKENIYLDYKLNGDTSWRPVDIERGMELRFNNLEPGAYKVQVRKRNGFGAGNYSYNELRFNITMPWYKKWWFYIVMGALVAGMFRLYYNIRTRQMRLKQSRLEKQVAEKTRELQQKNEVLEKNDTIKTRLISIISHDIVTPLKFLTAAGKNLVDKRTLMSDDLQEETLREMINTSQELQLLSTNILNWIKYQNEHRRLAKENFNVHELTYQVIGVLNSLAKQKGLALKNEIPANITIYQYYEPLKILLYNLISNAISFSDHGSITIIDQSTANETVLLVKDEGVGMTPEQIQNVMGDQFIVSSANIDNRKGNGLGYLIIKDLLKMMGGSFHILSEKGKGTTVVIVLPVTHATAAPVT